MNPFQSLAARLFGFDYVLEVWKDRIYTRRVCRFGKYMVFEHDRSRLYPQGRIAGQGAGWEPLTPGAKKFYDLEVV